MNTPVNMEQIRAAVLALPEMAGWPEMAHLLRPRNDQPFLVWQLPALACQAVGGDLLHTVPAAAAMACWTISVNFLVDDMLDEDPRGAYRVIGYGNAANLAVACQAASLILIEQAALDMGRRVAAGATLARGALLTAFGQYLDAQNLRGEESYWRVIRAKAGTMYAVGLQLGALFGKADPATAQGLYDFGVLLGEMMQIFDDLADALKLPADSDWFQGRNNLAILYADTAAHARREEFKALLTRVTDPDALAEAQHILISSGAVSYCVYQLVERYRAARRLLDQLDLVDHTPIAEVLALHADLWVRWLLATGAATSRDLNGLLA